MHRCSVQLLQCMLVRQVRSQHIQHVTIRSAAACCILCILRLVAPSLSKTVPLPQCCQMDMRSSVSHFLAIHKSMFLSAMGAADMMNIGILGISMRQHSAVICQSDLGSLPGVV